MTAHRRPLLGFAAATALLLPACISIQAPVTPPEVRDQVASEGTARATEKPADPARRVQFAETPSRPGEVVRVNAARKDAGPTQQADNADPKAGVLTAGGEPPTLPVTAVLPRLTPPEPPLLAAVRAYVEGHPDRAIEAIKELDPANQEFVLMVLPALARGATADLNTDPAAASALVEHLRVAAAWIEPRAALRVEAVTFCRKVYGFGRYDPWPTGEPYRPNDQAWLYLEVRNLVSQPAAGPHGENFLTHAKVAVEVRDAHNTRVPQPAADGRRVEVVQFEKKLPSRGPVHDFHVLYAFPVPPAPGVYTVTVEVRDASGNRVVRTTPAEFRVSGP